MTTLTKEQQAAEAAERAAQRRGAEPDDPSAGDGVFGDTTEQISDVEPQARQVDQPEQREVPKPRNPRQDMRNSIIASFREKRGEDEDNDDTKELLEYARGGLPPELVPAPAAAEPEPLAAEPEIDPAQVPTDQPPAKVKLKVRGQEVEYTQEELIALAQKSAAGDDYLTEARSELDKAKALRKEIEQGARAAPSGEHPAGDPARTGASDDPSGDEHPVSAFNEIIKDIQYGDPDQVGARFESAVEDLATKKADEAATKALQQERIRDEQARANKLMADFAEKNPEIAKDKVARAALESILIQRQVDDIVSLGVSPDQIPSDPRVIANWHRDLRVNGYKVKPADVLLQEGHKAFLDWKQPVAPAPKDPAPPRAPARIDVTVDRAARREAIPTQPTRAAVPVRREQPAAPAEPNRTAIVQRIAEQRRLQKQPLRRGA